MEIENVQLLVFITYIVEVIIQIYLINRFRKRYDIKDWFKFLGITIAIFIFDILAYNIFAVNSIGLGSAISTLFICGFILCCNSILLIVGLVVKKKNKYLGDVNDKKISKLLLFKSSIITLVCNLIILLIIPALIQRIIWGYGEIHIVKYLERKYGSGDYKVVNISKQYSNSGMWDKYLSGYCYEMKSNHMEDTFSIEIDDEFRYIEADYFLPVYYSSKLYFDGEDIGRDFDELEEYIMNHEELTTDEFELRDIYEGYLQSWNNIDGVKYNPNYFIVPENYGKIPSINEFICLVNDYYS